MAQSSVPCCSLSAQDQSSIFELPPYNAPAPLEVEKVCKDLRTILNSHSSRVEEFFRQNHESLFANALSSEDGITLASKRDTDLPFTLLYKAGKGPQESELLIFAPSTKEGSTTQIKRVFIITNQEIKEKVQASAKEDQVSQFLLCHGVSSIMPMETLSYTGRSGFMKQRMLIDQSPQDLFNFLQTLWMPGGKPRIISDDGYQELLTAARQIAEGLQQMHACHTCYLNLNTDNCFLMPMDNSIRFTDLAFTAREGEFIRGRGSPGYVPPEIYSIAPSFGSIPASPKMDIWSLGVCLVEMFLNYNPFIKLQDRHEELEGGESFSQHVQQSWKWKFLGLLQKVRYFLLSSTEKIFLLAAQMIDEDPQRRPSIEEVVARLGSMPKMGDKDQYNAYSLAKVVQPYLKPPQRNIVRKECTGDQDSNC